MNHPERPTIASKLDRVTGSPASIYTPPEDLVDDPNVPASSGARLARYAEAIRNRIRAMTGPPVIGTSGGLALGATEFDIARAVMAVADQETAELRGEVEQRDRALTALDRLLGEARDRAEAAEAESARLASVVAAVEETADLDYNPSEEQWVCGDHGIPECTQGDCSTLPWPTPNGDQLLAAFTDWADGEFRRVVRPYDESDDPNRAMPDEAFRSYSVWEWPVGAFLEATVDLRAVLTSVAPDTATPGGAWKPGDPCASCGSTNTTYEHDTGAACRDCRKTDADEELAWTEDPPEVARWKGLYREQWNRAHDLQERLKESTPVYRGWRGYGDGSRSDVERWVRATNGDWVSLDSERRTDGDIILEHFSCASSADDKAGE